MMHRRMSGTADGSLLMRIRRHSFSQIFISHLFSFAEILQTLETTEQLATMASRGSSSSTDRRSFVSFDGGQSSHYSSGNGS